MQCIHSMYHISEIMVIPFPDRDLADAAMTVAKNELENIIPFTKFYFPPSCDPAASSCACPSKLPNFSIKISCACLYSHLQGSL